MALASRIKRKMILQPLVRSASVISKGLVHRKGMK